MIVIPAKAGIQAYYSDLNQSFRYPEFWESMKHAALESMPAEIKEAYLKVSPHPEKLQSFHDKSVKRMLDFKDWPPEALRSIQATILIIIGDADIVRPEHGVEMYRLLPHARLAILPGTDHMTLVNNWPVSMIEASKVSAFLRCGSQIAICNLRVYNVNCGRERPIQVKVPGYFGASEDDCLGREALSAGGSIG